MSVTDTTKLLVGLGAAAGAGHLGYPITLAVASALSRRRKAPVDPPPTGAACPAMTVIIPAFREVGPLPAKIANVRANGYEGELEIVVVSEDPETAACARGTGVTVIEPEGRLGKAQAANVAVQAARTPIVVITDANNALVPGALAALAAHFVDPIVGGVAGEKTEEDEGEAIYWRFESWLKRRESMLGTTLGVVGELFAVRTEAWRPIPLDIGMDDLWTALDLAERGYAVRYEPAARSVEPAIPSAEQWERRTRNVAGALHVFSRKRHLLHPRRGLLAFEIVGHKLWRSTLGPLAHVALVAVALATSPRNVLARLVVLGHAVGVAAFVAGARGRRLPRPLAALRQVLYLQLVALGGMVRFARREVSPTWRKPER